MFRFWTDYERSTMKCDKKNQDSYFPWHLNIINHIFISNTNNKLYSYYRD